MIAPLLQRELTLLGRDTGCAAALLAHLAVMLGGGVVLAGQALRLQDLGSPAATGLLLDRLVTWQWIVSALVAPWLSARIGRRLRSEASVRWLAGVAAAPWRAALASLGAAWICVCQLVLLPLPILLVARAIGAVAPAALAGALLELLILLAAMAVAGLLSALLTRTAMGALGAAYGSGLAILAARYALIDAADRFAASALVGAALAVGALLLARMGRRRLLELEN